MSAFGITFIPLPQKKKKRIIREESQIKKDKALEKKINLLYSRAKKKKRTFLAL